MNIFGNLIKDTEIIGVGDVNGSECTPSDAVTEVTYSFKVFTRSNTIMIYSPAFGKNQNGSADAWLKRYLQIKQLIATQIGELEPNS